MNIYATYGPLGVIINLYFDKNVVFNDLKNTHTTFYIVTRNT